MTNWSHVHTNCKISTALAGVPWSRNIWETQGCDGGTWQSCVTGVFDRTWDWLEFAKGCMTGLGTRVCQGMWLVLHPITLMWLCWQILASSESVTPPTLIIFLKVMQDLFAIHIEIQGCVTPAWTLGGMWNQAMQDCLWHLGSAHVMRWYRIEHAPSRWDSIYDRCNGSCFAGHPNLAPQ